MIHRKYFVYDISECDYIGEPILVKSYSRPSKDSDDDNNYSNHYNYNSDDDSGDENINYEGERYTDEEINIEHSGQSVGSYHLEIIGCVLYDWSHNNERDMGFGTDVFEIMKTHRVKFNIDSSDGKLCVKWNDHIIYTPDVNPDRMCTYKYNDILLVYDNKNISIRLIVQR